MLKEAKKRVCFLGGGLLLRSAIDLATDLNFEILVVTSPRHASEKSGELTLEDFLISRNLNFICTSEINKLNFEEVNSSTLETIFISIGASWIFDPKTINNIFNSRILNLHGTRLPQNRGGGGFSWQILTRNRFGFCTIHLVDSGIDTGPIVRQEEFLYPSNLVTPKQYNDYYISKNKNFLQKILVDFLNDEFNIQPINQNEALSTHWPRLNSEINSWIDWSWSAYELESFINAFGEPYTGARTKLNSQDVFLHKASVNFQDGNFHSFQSGLIYRIGPEWICVAVPGGALIIEVILDSQGRDMLSKIRVGDRFITEYQSLQTSKSRPIYTPQGLKSEF